MASEENSITLGPLENGKLGISHCDVTKDGYITVVGEQKYIADGEKVSFDRVSINASRKGDVYTFVKN
jgi:hypothetical protein